MSARLKAFPPSKPGLLNGADDLPANAVIDRSIGDLIRDLRKLTDEQVEEILKCQREHGIRFGEAAIALGLVSNEDVLWALSQQFHYTYPKSDGERFDEELITATDPFSEQAETFREMRSHLLSDVLAPEHGPRALAVLSPNIGDGKSYFAANIAVTLSQLGGRTLLIDADMRTPRLHRMFNVPNNVGLSSILAGRAEANALHRITGLPSLYLLPVGVLPPNPLELIQRPAFGLLINEFLGKFNHVVVDSPAAAHGADARVLASRCGAALVIARRGTSRMKAVHALTAQLSKGGTKLAGVLINER